MTFLEELKKRKVFRAASAYAVTAFVVTQAYQLVYDALHLPGWTFTFLVILLIIGFPAAVIIAWIFD